jgi:hypothetical protein
VVPARIAAGRKLEPIYDVHAGNIIIPAKTPGLGTKLREWATVSIYPNAAVLGLDFTEFDRIMKIIMPHSTIIFAIEVPNLSSFWA